MYSPFLDSSGRTLGIEKLKYIHLAQLKECDEGHHLEYKSVLEDGGKAQIAKEIASFANCEGGWLIIGVDDKNKEIVPIEKCDYSQKIGKIATRITPMPEFETKFISIPEDRNKGVLVIYVYEGKNAPYICNGSVYVRSGSSKEPIKAAERGNIEYLIERSRTYQKELEGFFKRDYYFAYDVPLKKEITYPIVSVYIKNIALSRNSYLDIYSNRDKVVRFVLEQGDIFKEVQYSMNSIIFLHSPVLPSTASVTFVIELFYDWSCKIYMPLGMSSKNELECAKEYFEGIGICKDTVDAFKIVNGSTACNEIFYGLLLFERIARKYKLKEKNYVLGIEIENAQDHLMFFSGEKYKKYVAEHGLPFAHKEVNRSKMIFLKKNPKVKFKNLGTSLVVDFFGAAFGFRSSDLLDILNQSNEQYFDD